MSVKIYVTAKEVWRFFRSNESRLKNEMVKIAENEDTGTVIYLTEECLYPALYVYDNEECVYEELAVSSADCEEIVEQIYSSHLSEKIPTSTGQMISRQDAEDLIYETEDKLTLSLIDFLDTILGFDYRNSVLDEKEIEEILDHIASYLSEEKQLVIDRPMIINDETTGEDVFYRYPYEEFVFTR